MGRWLTASLLAVNGAGALAVFNAADKLSHLPVDGSFFVLGVLAALSSAVLNQKSNQHSAAVVGEALGQAIVVSQTGEVTEPLEKIEKDFRKRLMKGATRPELAGWASALLFVIGAVSIGLDSPKADPVNSRRCATIQHDMLSARPRASDDPAVFVALGCKPQGGEPLLPVRAAR
jgi:hypothetical protein